MRVVRSILFNPDLKQLPSTRAAPALWAWGALFIAAYVLLERVSFLYQLDGLGITLWSPAAGASLIFLLLMGVRAAPFVFVASLLTDLFVYSGPRGFVAPVATSLVLSLGFAALAAVLASAWSRRKIGLSRVMTFLLIVPAGILLLAAAYCLVLYLTGILFADRFLVAVRNFWIGETLGVMTLMPAAVTVLQSRTALRSISRSAVSDALMFAVLLAGALGLIFGLQGAHEYQFFYLLFVPVVWIAVRTGYPGVSLALPVMHASIVWIATELRFASYGFIALQLLMLVLSGAGLLLGAAVTEVRDAAERLHRRETELARATRHALVGATGTAVAHEISQPLAAATNYMHAARRILQASDAAHPPEAVEALVKAEGEARRVRETLERVRDYVSSGRLELSDVDLHAVTTKIADVIGRDARDRGVRIDIIAKPHLPTLRGDAIQLEQVLLNLISNAVDASATLNSWGGVVTVELFQHGDRLVAAVEDTGPGVSPTIADRLCEPFETTKKSGMGLGLTLVRQIVDAHAGTLTWHNVTAGGARFTIELRIDGPSS